MSSTPQSLTLLAKAESLGPVTEFVRKGAREAALPESRIGELDLLMEEVFMNIARHAYPKDTPGVVNVTYRVLGPGELSVEVEDEGIAFDPTAAAMPDLTLDLAQRPIGGLGIFLLRTFASALSYQREESCNRLTFRISSRS